MVYYQYSLRLTADIAAGPTELAEKILPLAPNLVQLLSSSDTVSAAYLQLGPAGAVGMGYWEHGSGRRALA